MTSATLCIFARPPVAGHTKSRLAADLGSEAAAAVAQALLADTVAAARAVPGAQVVLSVTQAFDFGPARGLELWVQPRGDLGSRLEWTLRRALRRSPWAVALGADTPGLSAKMLESTLSVLEERDAVLGPADDGGFYLLGLRACPNGLLAGIRWSHPQTLSDTEARLRTAGMGLGYTSPWFDLDTVDDLRRARALLETGSATGPHLAAAVESLAGAGGGPGGCAIREALGKAAEPA